jgi:AcrR family transcriptional regulator
MENRRIRMTKKLIKDALVSLLQKKTLDKISVREICDVADVNRSTFYDHYEDIYALFHEMENDFISQIPTDYSSGSTEEQFYTLVAFVDENEPLYVAIRKYSALVVEKLTQMVLENYLGRNPDVSPDERLMTEMRALYVVNGSCSILDDWIRRSRYCTEKRLAGILCRLAVGVFESDGDARAR